MIGRLDKDLKERSLRAGFEMNMKVGTPKSQRSDYMRRSQNMNLVSYGIGYSCE